MADQGSRVVWSVLLLLGTTLSGCTSTQVRDERNALWTQNEEAQAEIDRLRLALDESELENTRLRLRSGSEQISSEETQFEGIEGVEISTGPGTVTVHVPGDVLFASGKTDLRSSAKSTLDEIAGVINNEYPSSIVRIEGYTDTDPIKRSKWRDNLDLSLQRAAAVHRYLQKRGISANRMYAAGFGETRQQSSKSKSRRVEIVVVKD